MLLYLLLFFACLGSFCACYIYRFSHKEDIVLQRSHCPYCYHTLSWWQLIPIISFLLLKGKCHYCKHKISIYYPIHELLHIITGLFLYISMNNYLSIIFIGIYLSINYMLAYIDYQTQLVPTSLLTVLLLIIICIRFPSFMNIINALFYLLILTILYFIKKDQLGYGDVLYISIQSLLFPVTYTSFAIVIACIMSLFFVIKKENLHKQIPFIPFLACSFTLLLFIS